MARELTDAERERLDLVRRWVRLLDSLFRVPGTGIRFGLDAAIGLVPGLGDAVSSVLSLFLVAHASRLGISRLVLLRMIVNVVVDALIGVIPLAGDIFDVGWKSNSRNLQLLERQLARGVRGPTAGDYAFLAAVVALLVLAVAVPILAVYLALQALDRSLF